MIYSREVLNIKLFVTVCNIFNGNRRENINLQRFMQCILIQFYTFLLNQKMHTKLTQSYDFHKSSDTFRCYSTILRALIYQVL